MWMLALSQSTSWPSIQIFSDLVIGIGYNLPAMRDPMSDVVPVTPPASETALLRRAGASPSPETSSVMAAARVAARGVAFPGRAAWRAQRGAGAAAGGPGA